MAITEQVILDEFNREIAAESQPLAGIEIRRTFGTCTITVGDVIVTKLHITEDICKSVASHFGVKPSWKSE